MSRRTARQPVPPAAIAHLRDADPVLRALIDRVGPFEASFEPDLWRSLIDAIAGQQLSVRAADAIVDRIAALAPDGGFPGPDQILATPEDTLRACGLSRPKARYVRDLAEKWTDGTLGWAELPELRDEQVVERLTAVKGIGRWTAEMVLIFTLGRPDVLPAEDLALRVAVQREYGLAERPLRPETEALAQGWRPFRSAATLYLWRSLNPPSPDQKFTGS